MFQRYTDETKRAIYFAAQLALYDGAEVIDSNHLLRGLLTDCEARANTIFRLCQLFPEDAAKQSTLKNSLPSNVCELSIEEASGKSFFRKEKAAPNVISLGGDEKRIFTFTLREANRLRDYWIDTEHLVLGILREGDTVAAVRLRSVGLDLETSRQRVVDNRNSRPAMPDPVLFWLRQSPIGFALVLAFALGVATALVLLGVGTVGILLTIAWLAFLGLPKYVRQLNSLR
jgi:ATP-dependent Clp protease ATP-binding subunit ClpA